MTMSKRALKRLLADEAGATAIEYGLIAALVAVGIIGSLEAFGVSLADHYTYIVQQIDGAW